MFEQNRIQACSTSLRSTVVHCKLGNPQFISKLSLEVTVAVYNPLSLNLGPNICNMGIILAYLYRAVIRITEHVNYL